jgi:hypothetical protein
MTKYQQARARRMENRHVGGRFKAGVLAPVMAHKFKGSEAGILSQSINFELDHIPGRLMSPIKGQVIAVYVPVQAMHALLNPDADYPGSGDVIRHALAQGQVLFPLEAEGEITKRLGINPTSVGGTKKVCSSARLAHNAAVNYLRRRKYVKAAQVLAGNTALTPAILGQTVLEKLNGVLDPEDRVNGAVDLNANLPVRGIGVNGSSTSGARYGVKTSQGTATFAEGYSSDDSGTRVLIDAQTADGLPDIFAEMGTTLSLTDFFRAERMDRLVREMRAFVDANPEKGEEIVNRWAMGLSLDIGQEPYILYEKTIDLRNGVVRATDGANLDLLHTYPASGIDFTVPVPATEFGGVVVTFAVVKPDEVLASQPHPMFGEPWAQDNFAADELALDPVPVVMRDLYSDVATVDEDTVALYVGNHGLKRFYSSYGWNRHLDPNDVAGETSIWQLTVPMSVTPDNVLYPSPLPQTPFADTIAEVCTYGIRSTCAVQTPLIFGPSPVEELEAIETDDVFEDDAA